MKHACMSIYEAYIFMPSSMQNKSMEINHIPSIHLYIKN